MLRGKRGFPWFLGLFKHASCVCTNSFHGTAFSIIFRKPFWGTPHNVANSRIADLLESIDLSDRQVSSVDEFPENPLKIDYSIAEQKLNSLREESIAFLEGALNS